MAHWNRARNCCGCRWLLFHSNLQDNLRDVKDNASRTAIDESRDAVRKAFDEEHIRKLVEDTAKEKIGAVTDQMVADKVNAIADKMIQEHLGSKLQPIEERIVLIGRISECESRIHLGYRSSYDELITITHDTRDKYVRQFAQATLTGTAKNYEDYWTRIVKETGTNSALGQLSAHWVKPGQPQPTGPVLPNVVGVIKSNDDLNAVALAFLSFRELTGEKVKIFDFASVNSWCVKNPGRCK